MLVLSRRVGAEEGEDVIITASNGERIVVRPIEVRKGGEYVRLGFVAPPGVVIDRKEIDDRKRAAPAA